MILFELAVASGRSFCEDPFAPELVLPAPEDNADFAPLVLFDVESPPPAKDTESAASAIEIIAGAVSVRLDGATPAARIGDIGSVVSRR